MPPGQDKQPDNNKALADKYRPLLVLFPEIKENSVRKEHHHDVGNKPGPAGPEPGRPPLDMDYHPRDIRLVLDNTWLPVRGWDKMTAPEKRERLLAGMAGNEALHIDLVDRRGPQQVDNFWSVYAGIKDKDTNYPRKAYTRIIRGNGLFKDYISIQYWLAYFFDDWANVHEMDWEMVSVILKKTATIEEPVACVFCSHIGAFRKPWKDVDKAIDASVKNEKGLHPVVYVANGSHASYFSDYPSHINVSEPYLNPGLRTLIRALGVGRPFTDYVLSFEQGDKRFPEVEVIPEDEREWTEGWRWLKFNGNWGSPAELSIFHRLIARIPLAGHLPKLFQRPIKEAGPKGPNTRGTCWHNPFDWGNLECLDAPENRNWFEASCPGPVTRISPRK